MWQLLESHMRKKAVHKTAAARLSASIDYEKGIPPEALCGFQPGRLTTDMTYVGGRIQELAEEKNLPMYMMTAPERKHARYPQSSK